VTQLFLPRPKKRAVHEFLRRNIAQQVVELASDMQVTIIAEREPR
jgi:K+-sensing histidine kinase KdpD